MDTIQVLWTSTAVCRGTVGMQFQMGELGRGHFGCTCSASLSSRKRAQGSGGKRSHKINSGATEAAAESNTKADEEKIFTVTVQNHSLKSFESLKKKQSKQRLGQAAKGSERLALAAVCLASVLMMLKKKPIQCCSEIEEAREIDKVTWRGRSKKHLQKKLRKLKKKS
ncbi:hypothetical protein YC2023_062600 [Brassica napus]